MGGDIDFWLSDWVVDCWWGLSLIFILLVYVSCNISFVLGKLCEVEFG